MKKNQILSLLLSILMIFSLATPILAAPEMANISVSDFESISERQSDSEKYQLSDETKDITVYINLSKHGEVLRDKNQNYTAMSPVTLSGKESYTIDDAFTRFHELYFDDGKDGYKSEDGFYGLYVTKLWGEDYASCGYQVNKASEPVYGLSHQIKDGDVIDTVIYENEFTNLENYSVFDKYETTLFAGDVAELCFNVGKYDKDFNLNIAPDKGATITVNGTETDIKTDKNGKAKIKFENSGKYVISAKKEKKVGENTVTAITAPVCVATVKEIPDAVITVPKNATLYVGSKGKLHFVNFTEEVPSIIKTVGENKEYYFELDNSKKYNFRVSGDKYITYAGTFQKTADFSMTVTKQMLNPTGRSKKTIDRLASSNGGQNVADIYLNINPEGHLKLKKGDKYQIVSLRNWEAVNNTSVNYFIEPDYNFKAIDENGKTSKVVSVDENGVLTAKSDGTAIVLVTYDAMTLNFDGKEDFYGAIYPENTGVFVVTVGDNEAEIKTGITINEGLNSPELKLSGDTLDAEHDCIYFVGKSGEYKFKPETDGLKISVASPVVGDTLTYNGFKELYTDNDGYCTVPLYEGRNIVKLEDGKTSAYHVITAKSVNYTVNGGDEVNPGDTISIVFDKLYHPANKLAGVYNMSANILYTEVSGYENSFAGSVSARFNFASTASAKTVSSFVKENNLYGTITYTPDTAITVPEDYEFDVFTLSGGVLYVTGWGDSYGNHRYISYETGKAPNLSAAAKNGYLGRLPDIEIPISKTTSPISSISLDCTDVKTQYFAGESFDTSKLVVNAHYDDGTTQIAKNYTVEPNVLTADTDKVTVTYKGKSESIDVTVKTPLVTAIEITTAPSKLVYTEGETFSPAGMVVKATYEHGVTKEIFDYSYSPNRTLKKDDTSIIVTYTGENGAESLQSVHQAITVKERDVVGNPEVPSTISVYFTLLGDEKHGNPTSGDNTHTKKKNNLTVWIERICLTLEKGSYVIDAIEKALSFNGIPFDCEDEYISSVKGLSEQDNGPLSGWMYTLNGNYPLKSVAAQKLRDNDEIIFHYTDDYTTEKTGFAGGGSGGSSDNDNDEKENDEKNDESVTEDKKDNDEKDSENTNDEKNNEDVTENKKEENAENSSDNSQNSSSASDVFSENTYSDVKIDDWFYDSVKFVYNDGIMKGTDKGFEPKKALSRGMLAMMLWRIDGTPDSETVTKFNDVSTDNIYADAVSWAEKEEIVFGMDDNYFGVNENITREQFVTMLYRYSVKKGLVKETTGSLDGFADANEVSDYAVDALIWAIENGIINGTDNNKLAPTSKALRMEAAAIVERYCNKYTK